jgi:hypothetical protein
MIAGTLVAATSAATPALADLNGGANHCDASVALVDRKTSFDMQNFSNVLTIPRTGTAQWTAVVDQPVGDYTGSLQLELPPVLRWFAPTELRHWSGTSQNRLNSGTYNIDVPSWVPGGVEFAIVGEHTDQHGSCSGTLRLMVDGGPGLIATLVSLVLTIGAAIGLWALGTHPLASGARRARVVGRSVASVLVGGLLLLMVGINLALFGLIAIGSGVITVLAAVGLAAGGWIAAQRS